MTSINVLSRTFALGLATVGLAGPASAQPPAADLSGRTITVVVPFAAGGGVDAAARLVMPKLAERLKATIVIENVPGASGSIGTQRVIRARPDGSTLLFAAASPINVAPQVAPSTIRYDGLKDLTAVTPVAVSSFVLIGRRGLPAANTAELIAHARRNPGRLTYGTDGVGTSLHVTATMITQRAGVELTHVPYKSGTQVMTDVAGGQIDLAVLPVALAAPFVRDRSVVAYGVTTAARAEALPDAPALAETPALAGLDVEAWLGLLAPAQLDPAIAQRIARETAAALEDAGLGRQMRDAGLKPFAMAPAAFADYLAREKQSLGAVIAAAGIRTE